MSNKSRIYLSPIGKYLRKLRIDLDLEVENMADALNTSVSRLTRIELGRTRPDSEFAEAVIRNYGNPTEVWSLVNRSLTKVEFPMSGLSTPQREQVFALYRDLFGSSIGIDHHTSSAEDPSTPIEVSLISAEEEMEMARIDEDDDLIYGVGFIDEDDADLEEVSKPIVARKKKRSADDAAFL